MRVVAQTEYGAFAVDLETEEIEPADTLPSQEQLKLNIPRVLGADALGSTIVAVVDRKPPLMISHDAGVTWRESGSGLPAGTAVAISEGDPDLIVYGSRNRLHVSSDGGIFWRALSVELPLIEALGFEP